MVEPAKLPHPQTALDYALAYAGCGLRVLPIRPGHKHPPMQAWQTAATSDPEIITNWFTRLYNGHGVGLAMGHQPDGRQLVAIDVDEHDPAHSGAELLHQLEQQYGPLPLGPRAITGAGGAHILLQTTVAIRNGTLGPGLDIRGEGGQIVVAPTIHPTTGNAYHWEDLLAPWQTAIPTATITWEQALNPPAPSPHPRTPPPGGAGDTPADYLRNRWEWEHELKGTGWEPHHQDSNGDQHWTRPGKPTREGASAVLHPGGPLVIFSTNPAMEPLRRLGFINRDGSVSITPLDFYAAYHYDGDIRAAARKIRQQMPTQTPPQMGWVPTIEQLNDGTPTNQELLAQVINWETFWAQEHGGEEWLAWPILPAGGRAVALFAAAKTGKSWITLACAAAIATGRPALGTAAQEFNMAGRHHVLYLDYEMSEDDVSDRLIALGYGPGDDLTYLHYVLPPLLPPLNTHNGREQVRRLAHLCQAEAVIIDTMGRAVEGEENSADPYRDYARLTGMILKGDGISVLRTDHAGKSKDRGQRGSSAKNDDVDVVLEIIKRSNAWEIKRLHTRITWVPENTVIEMVTYSDDRVDIRVASGSIPLWDDGTPELGREMLALGVDRTWNAEAANRAYKTAYGAGVKRSRYQSAMRWIKAQPLEFIDGSGTAPNDPTPEPDRVPTPPSYPLTGDGTVRVPGGTPPPAPGGYRAPPASGGREPVPSPTSEEEEPNLF